MGNTSKTNVNVWKIRSFTSEIIKRSGKDVHGNTVDNWFKKLEKENIHFVNRSGKEKVYDELDLEIALFIKEKRDEKWEMDAICNELPDKFGIALRSNLTTTDMEAETRIVQTLKEMQETIEFQLNNKFKELDNIVQNVEQKVEIELSKRITHRTNIEKREERMAILMTDSSIRKKLEREANQLWAKKDKTERTKWGGILGIQKVEDIEKKHLFVSTYINDNFERELLEEFGVEKEEVRTIE